MIARRTQGDAGSIEQGETRVGGVKCVTPDQVAANQVIPLPERGPVRGLVNAATDVAAAINQAVAAAALSGTPGPSRISE